MIFSVLYNLTIPSMTPMIASYCQADHIRNEDFLRRFWFHGHDSGDGGGDDDGGGGGDGDGDDNGKDGDVDDGLGTSGERENLGLRWEVFRRGIGVLEIIMLFHDRSSFW